MENATSKKPLRQLHFEHLLEGRRWRRNRILAIDPSGTIATLRDADPARDRKVERISGHAVPGMPNLHGHAFQRAMAGLTEYRARGEDSFWRWRRLMYEVAGRLSVEEIAVVARRLYRETLTAGYTSLAEFHYLHRPGSDPLRADPLRTATALIDAARLAGIGLTLLPAVYQRAGFDDRPADEFQRRFVLTTDACAELWLGLDALDTGAILGLAFHSLRAVGVATIRDLLERLPLADRPLHVHVAEQPVEVSDCLAHTGRRPVALLAAEVGLDERWCLVHATHVGRCESDAIAASGAVAGLCPSTEADLGDGLFPMDRFLAAGGRFGIGSDSHVVLDVAEELRWLEYGQRLRTGRRNVVTGRGTEHTGTALWAEAALGGAQALGLPAGVLEVGRRADIVVFGGMPGSTQVESALDRVLFAPGPTRPDRVYVAGQLRVADGCHVDQDDGKEFERIIASLARIA